MASKVFVNYSGSLTKDKSDCLRKEVADALGICCEDVVMVPGVTITVVDVPADLCAKRAKADKAAAKDEEPEAKPADVPTHTHATHGKGK